MENTKQTDAEIAATIAAAVAKTAADTASAVAKTATDAAATLAVNSSVATDISWIKKDISDIKSNMRDITGNFVTQEAFTPVRNIVFGLMATLGLAALGAVFKLIFLK